MIVIEAYKSVLQRLGLTTVGGVRAFRGHLVKDQRGRRDILRIDTADETGQPLVLYLKRIYKPYKKDGLRSFLRRGKVWSVARQEWNNMRALNRSGFPTADLVAFGEEVGPFWERFSFILTQAAPAPRTVEEFLKEETDPTRRRRVLAALARYVRALHDKGLASPDLFARHFFLDDSAADPRFYLIDMARLDRKTSVLPRRRARDLAALHVGLPLRHCPPTERLRFFRIYAGSMDRDLFARIAARSAHLLRRGKKFADFDSPGEGRIEDRG